MEEFKNFLVDFCEQNGMKIECGVHEKERLRDIKEAMEIISKSQDQRKIEIAKRVVYNYQILDDMMMKIVGIPHYEEFGKSFVRGVCDRMDCILDSLKRCLVGSLTALAKDERIEDFFLELLCSSKEEFEDLKKCVDEDSDEEC